MLRAAAVALAAFVVGCGEDAAPVETARPAAPSADPGAIHIHGLGVNPKDGALFIATHTGLFRVAPGTRAPKRVADRWQDTMGFAIVGPDEFLGSGHPDGRDKLPPFLGLIRSTDAGRSWRRVSRMGVSDFHVLEAQGSRIYGAGSNFETREAETLVSDDSGRSWRKVRPPGPLLALAIDPDDPDRAVVATEGGLARTTDAGRRWDRLDDRTGLLVWPRAGELYLVEGSGAVVRSSDQGRTWAEVGEVGGQPAAFEAVGDDLYVALHDGAVRVSEDGGASWSVRIPPPG